MTRTRISLPLLLSLLLAAVPAFAHEVTGNGFYAGLEHPVLGPDHLLAMLSVGILSAQIGGQALWRVPATFVSVMSLGGILGLVKFPIPFVEYGIVFSVIILGTAIALERKMGVAASMAFVGFFAVFHGYAHGIEMPKLASPVYYLLGFMSGTACIHLVGVAIGYLATRLKTTGYLLRFVGVLIAFKGFQILLG